MTPGSQKGTRSETDREDESLEAIVEEITARRRALRKLNRVHDRTAELLGG